MALPPLLPRAAGQGAKPAATHIIEANGSAVFQLKKRSPLQQIELYETSTNGQKKSLRFCFPVGSRNPIRRSCPSSPRIPGELRDGQGFQGGDHLGHRMKQGTAQGVLLLLCTQAINLTVVFSTGTKGSGFSAQNSCIRALRYTEPSVCLLDGLLTSFFYASPWPRGWGPGRGNGKSEEDSQNSQTIKAAKKC